MSDEGMKERPVRQIPSTVNTLPSSANPEEEFEHYYREAYKDIDRGITLITKGHKVQAGYLLQQGLTLLDKALEVKVERFDCSAEKVQQYAEMQHKMRCTRKEVLCHFAESQAGDGSRSGVGTALDTAPGLPEPPPSYDDYLKSLEPTSQGSSTSGSVEGGSTRNPVCYPALGDFNAAGNTASSGVGGGGGGSGVATPILSPQQGEMIFQVENGVQIFFIYPDGRVTSPSYPAFLAVFTFPEPIGGLRSNTVIGGMNDARGFLQVGEWSYPLVPAQSPVLHSFYGAYMFPDVTSGVEGTSVGVILPDSVDKETRQLFEQILTQLTQYQEQQVPPGVDAQQQAQDITASTSERIAAGAEVVSQGVVWGAGKLGELISFGSETLKTHIQPESQKREIDPKWHKTAKVARDVSGTAVKVSGYLLGQVGKATMALGRRLAPHLQHQGTKAITHLTGKGHDEASANMDGVLEVAAGAVKGASTIYLSLEAAAATLATNITDNTVKVVTHKYGEEAGALADNTLYAVGQTAMAGHNLTSLGVKGVAKRAAKDTGKALLHQHETKKGNIEKGQEVREGDEVEEEDEVMEGIEEGQEAGPHRPPRPIREKKKNPL